uniref:Uncharacterized protein n=1 Tax=Arundo donax TaxID=35708 RepID=A0A0A9AIS4_ARUDO
MAMAGRSASSHILGYHGSLYMDTALI